MKNHVVQLRRSDSSDWVEYLTPEDVAHLAYLRTLRPCARCGGRDWRKRAGDGRWLCSCWWTWGKRPQQLGLREEVLPIRPADAGAPNEERGHSGYKGAVSLESGQHEGNR